MDEKPERGTARFLEPIGSMAPHQMAISALLAISAVLGSFALYQWATAPAYQTLLVGEEPAVVSETIAELEAAGIPYRVSAGGTAIEVPRERQSDAEVRLAAAGVSGSSVTGYELLDQQGFSTSSFQQRINYQRALEGELTRTIVEMRDVLAASVHLSIPEDELFRDDEEPPTASVVIDSSGSIGRQSVEAIVSVVSSAVPGMAPDGVTVTDTDGRVLTDTGGAGGSADEARRSLEQQLETSAQTMLIAAFGHENALVRVNAIVELDDSERETITYDPASQIAIREQVIQESYVAESDDAAGVVGVTDDIVTGLPDVGGSGSDYTRSEQTSEYGVDRVRTVERNSSGDIIRLSVAVVVNDSLDPAPDLEQVSQVVSAAVGLDPERGDVIAVEAIAFDADFTEAQTELVEAAAPPSDPLAPVAPYLGIARTALAIVLLIVVLLSLRKGTKHLTSRLATPAVDLTELEAGDASTSPGANVAGEAAGGAGASDGEGALALDRGPNAANDVMKIIDSQPIEVASLLRSWANEAAVKN